MGMLLGRALVVGFLLVATPLQVMGEWSFTATMMDYDACTSPLEVNEGGCEAPYGGNCSGYATKSECEAARARVLSRTKPENCGMGSKTPIYYAATPCQGQDDKSGIDRLADSLGISTVGQRPASAFSDLGQMSIGGEARGLAFRNPGGGLEFEEWVRQSRFRPLLHVNRQGLWGLRRRPLHSAPPEFRFFGARLGIVHEDALSECPKDGAGCHCTNICAGSRTCKCPGNATGTCTCNQRFPNGICRMASVYFCCTGAHTDPNGRVVCNNDRTHCVAGRPKCSPSCGCGTPPDN